MTNDIQLREPAQIIAEVNSVAGACRLIVAAAAMEIQGRRYITVEGWQAIAAAHGCTASADSVTAVEGGIAAVATIRRLSDGAILGQAEGFVGADEKMWAARPLYARRAMAQTRAISRACRSAFAHVVVAMNAGHGTNFATTPAEEVPEGGFEREERPARESTRAKPATPPVADGMKWSADQAAEGKALAADIAAHGPEAEKECAAIRSRAKVAGPAQTIDDLGTCLRKWQDIADEAGRAG